MNIFGLLKNNYTNINRMNLLQRTIADSTNRLSSGQKLTKDSPSDILRMSRFDSKLRGNQVAQRNIQDGVSLIQTTDSALASISSIGQRLKELSAQYNNGTLSADDKNTIENETKGLTKQISNIINNTSYNNKNVFSSNSISIMAGNDTSDVVKINIPELKTTISQTNSTGSTISNVPKFTLPTPDLSNFPDQGGWNGYTVAWDLDGYLTYDGNLTNGLFDGSGLYFNKGQEVYAGTWVNGVISGNGIFYNNDGSMKYDGEITNGTPNGYGKYYSNSGVIQYEGFIKNGYREGEGKTYDPNGNLIETKEYTDYSGGNSNSNTTSSFSLKDIGDFDVKEVLTNNFVDNNILKPVTDMRQELGTTEEVLNFRSDYLQSEETINTDALSHIQDVDIAKETLNISKSQILLNVNTTLFSQINDMTQNMVKALLSY